jgi:hypothetical protein
VAITTLRCTGAGEELEREVSDDGFVAFDAGSWMIRRGMTWWRLSRNIWGVRSGMSKIRGPLGLELSLFEVGRHVLGPRIGGGRPTLDLPQDDHSVVLYQDESDCAPSDLKCTMFDLVAPQLQLNPHRLSSLLGHSPSPSCVSLLVHASVAVCRP